MEEKQKKEVNVKEEKQAMGIIWLVGILVILLVCSIVYSISLRNKLVQEQQAQEQQSEEQQAKVENQNSIEVKESEEINNDITEEDTINNKDSKNEKDIAEEQYSTKLTDAKNGELAFSELVKKGELKTKKHTEYYTYVDDFENVYNIKEIKKVSSEKGIMGNDNWAALFKVNVTYIDNNDKTKTMSLAILLLENYEVQNCGTYDNYTGTTSFVKGFANFYDLEN